MKGLLIQNKGLTMKKATVHLKRMASSALIGAALFASAPAQAVFFNLTSTGNAQADAGFQAAANYWSSIFTDNVTINITAGYAALGTNIIGQASSSYYNTNYSAMKSALAADSKSAADATMVSGLSAGSSYSKWINGTTNNGGAAHVQSGITAMEMTTANAKAMGLLGATATADATITFSSLFSFDFDRSNGISAGMIDFVGVAIHELGHAMGFTSGVDILDYNSGFADAAFNPYATMLDFTRCSAASQAAGADMDWTVGTAAKDFAIDGSCTAVVSNAWSTGTYKGDGRQASHWKDNLGRGIMDPTFAYGELGVISANDILAFDVIGWDTKTADVPEPMGILLIGAGLFGMAFVRRNRKVA